MRIHALVPLFVSTVFCTGMAGAQEGAAAAPAPLYTYELVTGTDARYFDECMALASLQGLINRHAPTLYVLNNTFPRPAYWLERFSSDGRWLEGRPTVVLPDLSAVRRLAGARLKGAVVWDPAVPASLNVATTIAGVEDLVVMSPEFAAEFSEPWGLDVVTDLRGKFTGDETGSAKNDAYRWAIREYIQTGRCSSRLLCLYTDSFEAREGGNVAYIVQRDWPVSRRAFVYDLSPWGDEAPGDDPGQALGTDLETYQMMLAATMEQAGGRHMTEVAGFFNFFKYSNMPPRHPSRHDPVPTEWETVYVISPYNAYQNTATEFCYNQSLHAKMPFTPLKQNRPTTVLPLENKAYVAILMADYDSTYPLYHFMPNFWDEDTRGDLPLNWGINPNLIETYPDVISYFHETKSANDYFVADASAAGYMNPNRVEPRFLPLFIRHNRRFYELTDTTISGMVLDWDQPTPAVKDAFAQFSPDGFATIVMDLHEGKGRHPDPHVWKGMPVVQLYNNCDFNSVEQSVNAMSGTLAGKPADRPGVYYFRGVWVPPSRARDIVDGLRERLPEVEIEFVDLYTFFDLFKRHYGTAQE
jgi:hypothetical protein